MNKKILYKFSNNSSLRYWSVVDDVVMGGYSLGSLKINKSGNGVFSGKISLYNNGGFSSIRYYLDGTELGSFKNIILKIYGDNKFYQLRIKNVYNDRHVYIKKFFAKSEWHEIKIPLDTMVPSFRGRKLNMNNFNFRSFSELGILIGNKTEEDFELIIESIRLE